jgi:hypothetical protein
VFQRSANYLLPRHQRAYTKLERWLQAHVPPYRALVLLKTYLSHEVLALGFGRLNGLFNAVASKPFRALLQRQVPVPAARWKTSLLGEWEQEPGGAFKATEVAWENIFQLTESGQYWADLGILAEYAQSTRGGGAALELGLLAEKREGKHTATLNLVAEHGLAGGETELEYAFGWRYELDEAFEPGIELHGELGEWSAPGSLRTHSHSAGPSFSGEWEAPGGDGELKYTAAVLFGLTGTAPDSTVRLQLEWEF